jgi:hypothetical protein
MFVGKIAVIGGCREYTGAPYFAAISALKVVSIFNFFNLINCASMRIFDMLLFRVQISHMFSAQKMLQQ